MVGQSNTGIVSSCVVDGDGLQWQNIIHRTRQDSIVCRKGGGPNHWNTNQVDGKHHLQHREWIECHQKKVVGKQF